MTLILYCAENTTSEIVKLYYMLCLQYAFFTKVDGFVNFNQRIIKVYIYNPESQIWPPLDGKFTQPLATQDMSE